MSPPAISSSQGSQKLKKGKHRPRVLMRMSRTERQRLAVQRCRQRNKMKLEEAKTAIPILRDELKQWQELNEKMDKETERIQNIFKTIKSHDVTNHFNLHALTGPESHKLLAEIDCFKVASQEEGPPGSKVNA